MTTLESSILRIFHMNGDAVGVGFLLDNRHGLTCAHVVASALGLRTYPENLPTEKIILDFPLVASGEKFTARVMDWHPPQPDGKGDLARLEILSPLPKEAGPVPMVQEENVWNKTFRAFGFPSGREAGVWADGKIKGKQALGWFQIEDTNALGYFVQSGFSGSPVWVEELGGVVGMVVAADKQTEHRSAFMIPAKVLVDFWKPAGQMIKGYRVIEKIAAGGNGEVYKAYQPQIDRKVAIKVILPEYANQSKFILRFEEEARVVARLEHPHIVPLYDYWRDPTGAFLVMRWFPDSLSNAQKHPLSLEQIIRVFEQVGSALTHIHQKDVFHRDLKPANILLDEKGNAYLSDFGIAKDFQANKNLTKPEELVMGTLSYAAPEQLRGEIPTPQSDIFSLGVILFELLTGQNPLVKIPYHERLFPNEAFSSFSSLRPDLPAELDIIIQHATAFSPEDRYASVQAFLSDLLRAVKGEVSPVDDLEDEEVTLQNPYKGIEAFDEADAEIFFGRENLVQNLLERMREMGEYANFLAVVGPSGSGKSSVVKAGLLPALRQGALPGSENWFIVKITPSLHPLEELEDALVRIAVTQPPDLVEWMKKDERGLVRAARSIMPKGGKLLLVVDQFEEIFTLSHKDEAEYFLKGIFAALTDPKNPIRVIATLRADFYDRPLMHPQLGQLFKERQETITVMTRDELIEAIQKPAESVGAKLETGLVELIANDILEEPGALPLLQFALTELFEHRQGRRLTHEAYQEIGGVRGALRRRAEKVFSNLTPVEQVTAKQIFLRLVTPGEGREDTRRKVLRAELDTLENPETIQKVLDTFDQARLLSFDRDSNSREPTIEVAHEALIREWLTLREWLDENREGVRLHRHLTEAAREWQAMNQDSGVLYRGARLIQITEYVEKQVPALNELERAFLQASHVEE
ncbi:MAG: protein kinase, partial [Anaerolineales bacterium]|nr:protein kinase [Anaerolineales bacterium]